MESKHMTETRKIISEIAEKEAVHIINYCGIRQQTEKEQVINVLKIAMLSLTSELYEKRIVKPNLDL